MVQMLDDLAAEAGATRADLLEARGLRAAQTAFDHAAEEDVRVTDEHIARIDCGLERLAAARADIATKEP